MQRRRPVMLVILDGFGWREETADNAVRQAKTPTFGRLWETGPHGFLHTSGHDVGLPDGQMGNSEVGHLNIGAGRVVMQDLPRISGAIAKGEIKSAPALTDLIRKLKASGGTCHLIGLVSPGGVHSHQDHAAALAKILAEAGVPTLVHAITDGRDTPPQSAAEYLDRLRAALPPSVADRDRVRPLLRDGPRQALGARDEGLQRDRRSARPALSRCAGGRSRMPMRTSNSTSSSCRRWSATISGMQDGDGVLCFNFRADRVREILGAILEQDFSGFAAPARRSAGGCGRHDAIQRRARPAHGGDLPVAAAHEHPGRGGGGSRPHPAAHGRDREISARDLLPQRRARGALSRARTASWCPPPRSRPTTCSPRCRRPSSPTRRSTAIEFGKYDLIILNYANPDMVGHTGNLAAAIKAVETVDAGLGRIAAAIEKAGGALLVTADHGNCELMRDPQTGGPHTAHTTNPVPVVLLGGAQPRAGGRRPARRPRPDLARTDGIAEAARDDGRVAAGRLKSSCQSAAGPADERGAVGWAKAAATLR